MGGMYIFENPVLQRELLVNLRMPRGFVLLFLYQALLGMVVYFAWPRDTRLDLTENPADARKLVDMFFLGQYVFGEPVGGGKVELWVNAEGLNVNLGGPCT